MRFLLIADIHFRSPNCLDRRTDPEWYYRNQLVDDLRGRRAREGAFDVILICGDIAFKGAADEFAEAKKWIDELTAACGCDTRRVFVIPGNHDIDRTRITNSRAVQNAQQAILNAPDDRRADEFRAQVSFGETGRHLMEPLANYNEFAKAFGCQIWPPDHLMWRQDIALEDGVILRIHGLTSALFCAAYTPLGREERTGDLYLSPMQTVLETGQDVTNLVLCHHTPDWFSDYHDVDDHINGRAAIHVFGHEHRRRHHAEENFIRFYCSAVTGPVHERGWEPGYNVLDIDVRGEGETRKLHVEAEFMVWQARPPLFRRVVLSGGSERLVHDLPLPSRRPHLAAPVDGTAPADQEQCLAPDRIQTEAVTRSPMRRGRDGIDQQKFEAELNCKIGQNILTQIEPAWGTGAGMVPFRTTSFFSAIRWRSDGKKAYLAFEYEGGFLYLVSLPRIREYGTTSPELTRIPVELGQNCPSEFTLFSALPSPIDIHLENNSSVSILMIDRITGATVRARLRL